MNDNNGKNNNLSTNEKHTENGASNLSTSPQGLPSNPEIKDNIELKVNPVKEPLKENKFSKKQQKSKNNKTDNIILLIATLLALIIMFFDSLIGLIILVICLIISSKKLKSKSKLITASFVLSIIGILIIIASVIYLYKWSEKTIDEVKLTLYKIEEKKLENEILQQAYANRNFTKPLVGQSTIITKSELKSVAPHVILEDECDGYAILTNNNGTYECKSYVNCDNKAYVTEGFNKDYLK